MAKKKNRGRYVVRYEPIEDGWWLATVPEVPECITQGRSLRQTRERVREALELCVDDARTAELVDDVVLPARVLGRLERARAERQAADEARERASAAMRLVISDLVLRGVSTRDVGELLGLSHQRVAQLAAEAAKE